MGFYNDWWIEDSYNCFISYFNNGQTLFIPETFVILKSIDQGKSNSAFSFSKKVKKIIINGMKKKTEEQERSSVCNNCDDQ